MRIIKDILEPWQDCKRVIIKSIDSDGQYVCDLQKFMGEDADCEPIYETLHTNIGFTESNKPFEDLTQEEIDIINDVKI